jgi:DNA-binding GntR family transcriptional regulator
VILKIQSTSGALADRIRQEIVDGILSGGQALPQEELSARYGVSRSPLREALRQLEAEGWILYHPNRGASVVQLSAQDVRNLFGVRRILEAGATELCVTKLDAATMARARSLDAAMLDESDAATFLAQHRQFHMTLYEAVGNPKLVDAIGKHYVQMQRIPRWNTSIAAVRTCAQTDHPVLLKACDERDARAARAIAIAHVDHIEAIVLELLPTLE